MYQKEKNKKWRNDVFRYGKLGNFEDEHYGELRKRRSVKVTTIFGQIKRNWEYNWFLLYERQKPRQSGVFGHDSKQRFRLNQRKGT